MKFARMNLAALGIAVSFAAQSASAQVTQVAAINTGAAERIEAVSMLKAHSQEAASAACHMTHGVNPAESREAMLEAKTKFHFILDALEFGNADMNIPEPESHRKTIAKIDELREKWKPTFDAASVLLDTPEDQAALQTIKDNSDTVLENAILLMAHIQAVYANPAELTQSNVLLLEFAARQAVVTQTMAKVSCEIWGGNASQDRISALTDAMASYEITLDAMLNGMPAVGIQAAPSPQIADALGTATVAWKKTKGDLEIVVAGGEVSEKLKGELFHDLNVALHEMQKIQHYYVVHSKHDEDIKIDS